MKMEEATYESQETPVCVISPEFCAPQVPLHLTIIKKMMTLSSGNFTVTDPVHGNTLLKVKGPFPSYRGRRVIYNAAGSPVVTLRQKLLSQHTRWKVFRGESTEEADLIFSTKRSSLFQWNTKLDVFLASNMREEVCDFKVEATRNHKSCSVYAGASSSSSSTAMAQMKKKHGLRTIFDTHDEFFVTVAPYMDYAFVVALIIILYEMHEAQTASARNHAPAHH